MPRGPEPKNPRPQWSTVIRARRVSLDLKQEDISERSHDVISQGTVSDLERGKVALDKLTAPRLAALAEALEWTVEEMEAATGLSLTTAIRRPSTAELVERLKESPFYQARRKRHAPPAHPPEITAEHDLVVMPVYGLCEAGKPVSEMEEDPEVSPIGVPRSRWRPGVLVFRVQGESMQKEDGRGINPDDLVMVDTRMLDLVDGKVYVIYIPGSGVTLKRVRFLAGQAWLFSDNANQQEFPPFQVDDARILGRVYSKISVEVL